MRRCSHRGCGKEAVLGVRTTRPTRATVKTLIFFGVDEAPRVAERFCRIHGQEVVNQLINILTPEPQ